MKGSILQFRIGTLLATFAFVMPLVAQNQDNFSKVIEKNFSVNERTRLEIYNKYGNIDIVNTENPEIRIHVIVKVMGRNTEHAQDLLEMIHVSLNQEGDVVKAITEINEDFGKYFKNFGHDEHGLQINYSVTMPKTIPLYLSNKYGNVFIDELVSTSTIDIKYGKLTANKILHDSKQPLTKIFLAYSNGTIQETKWIEADIKYSKLNITENKALAIISKYSKVYINQGSSIVSESKYDTYEIDKLVNFVTTAAYGHFYIKSLSGKLQVETKYSDFIVDFIPASFNQIRITNSYGSYKLGIDASASYRINGYSKYCNIIYPESNARVNRFNENNEMKVTGTIGTNISTKSEVSVNSHYGNIRLID
jgi:hypothetical protein